jgi:protein-disulfide isomerase
MIRSFFILLLLSNSALASDPIARELEACASYCASLDKKVLGVRASAFADGYGRACVCQDPNAKPPIKSEANKTDKEARSARGDALEERKRPSVAAPIDCESDEVMECFKLIRRPKDANPRYKVPVDSLAVTPGNQYRVTIVEVSDYECPFCVRAQRTMRALKALYGPNIRFAFMHNPLSFHPRALPAAIAAQAAHRQGQFWAYNDLLFAQNRGGLSDENLIRLAQQAKLDVKRFKADLADPALAAEVKAQQQLAVSVGARGTPSFFINGRLIRGAQPLEVFKKEVDRAMREADALINSGTTDPDEVYRALTKDGLTQPSPKP